MSSSASTSEGRSDSLDERSSQSTLVDQQPSDSTHVPQQFDHPEYDATWNTYLDWDLPDLAYQDYSMSDSPNGQLDWWAHGLANKHQTSTQKPGLPVTIDALTDSRASVRQAMVGTSVHSSYSTSQPTPPEDFYDLNDFTETAPAEEDFFPVEFSTQDTSLVGNVGAFESTPQPWPQTLTSTDEIPKELTMYGPPMVRSLATISTEKAAPVTQVVSGQLLKSVSRTEVNKNRKLAHSVIEKNYRSRINTGMAELRECVPIAPASEDAVCNQPSGKVSVLADAVQYVRSLELENRSLADKMHHLQRRNDLLQKIALSKIGPNTPASKETIQTLAQEEVLHAPPESFSDLKARKRIKMSPLAVLDANQAPQASRSRRPTNRLKTLRRQYGSVTKLAVGTLTAIAVFEGMAENDSNGKMLFALPTEVVNRAWQFAASALRTISFGHDSPTFITLLKVLLMFTILLRVLALLSRMGTVVDEEDFKSNPTVSLTAHLTSSPHAGRRDAWLTSTQSVSIPSRHLYKELGALSFKLSKVVLRKLLGWQTYALLTGASVEGEKARIKAWDIAIDAQLAGGDSDICWNRLLFTFLASLTLPDTPARLMLKALHVQVINVFVHRVKYLRWIGSEPFAHTVSEHYWDKARIMQNNPGSEAADANAVDISSDPLPPCYAALLAQPSRQVFNVEVTMRAYCLALNKALDRMDAISDEGVDTVVDDVEVRSPIQALAAWWSSLCLRRALIKTLNATSTAHSTESAIYKDISLALTSAPRGSVAETRAITSRAIFCATERKTSIEAAFKILPITSPHNPLTLNILRPTISSICTTSVRISLRSAMLLERAHSPAPALLASLNVALDKDDVSLLGFAAAYQCLRECAESPVLSKTMPGEIRGLAARLRGLIGSSWSNWSEGHGVPEETVRYCVGVCAALSRERNDVR